MGKTIDDVIDKDLIEKKDLFIKNIESDMHYISNFSGDSISFDWIDKIEESCPFIDTIIRKPKLTLIKDEVVVPVEKAKRIMVDSVKDLSKHTDYIDDVDEETNSVRPSKILDIRSEETYNIYENRFLYTLIADLNRFVLQKEQLLKNFSLVDDKVLEYAASSNNGIEKIDVELRVTSTSLPQDKKDEKLDALISKQQNRIKGIKEFISSWLRSDVIKELDKAHVQYIKPPIKPTNIILKNPNFQVAVRLWEYIRNYDLQNNSMSKSDLESSGNKTLLGYLDDSFLIDYFVLDSISKKKKDEKEKICKYAILLLTQEIYRTMTLLLSNGIDISEEELLSIIAKTLKNENNNRLVGIEDIKKKFKSEINEYLERTQNYL